MRSWKFFGEDTRYLISSDGKVVKKINDNHPERKQIQRIKPEVDKDGYLRVQLNRRHYLVHRLVYSTFCGRLIEGLVVCHMDGSKTNNSKDNLRQLTQKENISHKRLHGTWQSCENHPHARLTNAQASLIKLHVWAAPKSRSGRLARGEAERIALEIGVAKSDVYGISRERSSYAEM